MITDGLSAIGSEMEVKDIAEIVWEQLKANDAVIEANLKPYDILPLIPIIKIPGQ